MKTLDKYKLAYRGQGVYITRRCLEEGIPVELVDSLIYTPEHKDFMRFNDIVVESLNKKQEAERPKLQVPTKTFKMGQALLCVMIQEEDTTYVQESKLSKVVELQFLGRIPMTWNYKIFSLVREIEQEMLGKGLII